MNHIIQYLTITLHLSKDVGNKEICAWHFDARDGNKGDRNFLQECKSSDRFVCAACKFNSN